MIYRCECGLEKVIAKSTLIYVDGKWVCKQAKCECGKYMTSEPTEGMPTIVRNDSALSNYRDKLWDGAKEKLIGERGINEPFE
tara:strand:+ start:394 stop:642 length:249 start_codon:yes stop_codon:yes gene_type:complete